MVGTKRTTKKKEKVNKPGVRKKRTRKKKAPGSLLTIRPDSKERKMLTELKSFLGVGHYSVALLKAGMAYVRLTKDLAAMTERYEQRTDEHAKLIELISDRQHINDKITNTKMTKL